MMGDDVRGARTRNQEEKPAARSRAALCPGILSPGAVEGSDFYITFNVILCQLYFGQFSSR